MDPGIHRGERPVAEAYRLFASREARGVSPVYEAWASAVADDEDVLRLLADLPPTKRQPNLVLAAVRFHGARTFDSFRSTLVERWDEVRETILARATQTNEAARCAVLLPFLAGLPQPLALLEVGASAGLCLLPDRYSYRYGEVTLDPSDGPSPVVVDCTLDGGIVPPTTMPRIAWRAGIDLSPVDVTDDDATAWLATLIWPGQPERLDRLTAALAVARREPPRVERGDLLELLPELAAEAPADATLVVLHSAVLAYLPATDRDRFVAMVQDLPGHWISNEGNGVVHTVPVAPDRTERFVLAVDNRPRALTDPHGRSATGPAGT